MIDGFHDPGAGRGLRAHDVMFEPNVDQAGRQQPRHFTRVRRRDQAGQRPVFGGTKKFQNDPHWRDCIPFYEYFHGDNGAGLGASHQTGWTALAATLAQKAWQR